MAFADAQANSIRTFGKPSKPTRKHSSASSKTGGKMAKCTTRRYGSLPCWIKTNNVLYFVGIERDISEEKKLDQTKNEALAKDDAILEHRRRACRYGQKREYHFD